MNIKSTRNKVVLYSLIVNGFAWVMMLLATNSSIDEGLNQIFVLLFLFSPLLVAIFMRGFKRANWKDAGLGLGIKKWKRWFLLSAILYPLIIILNLIISFIVNGFQFDDEIINNSTTIIGTSLTLLIPMFIKNIGEEFGWRGYLEPKMFSVGINRVFRSILVGIVWASWHLPLIVLTDYTSEGLTTYLPRLYVGVIMFSLVYGLLRDLTKTVWTPVILHTIANAVGNTLIDNSSLAADPYIGILPESYVSMLCWLLAAIVLMVVKNKMSAADFKN